MTLIGIVGYVGAVYYVAAFHNLRIPLWWSFPTDPFASAIVGILSVEHASPFLTTFSPSVLNYHAGGGWMYRALHYVIFWAFCVAAIPQGLSSTLASYVRLAAMRIYLQLWMTVCVCCLGAPYTAMNQHL